MLLEIYKARRRGELSQKEFAVACYFMGFLLEAGRPTRVSYDEIQSAVGVSKATRKRAIDALLRMNMVRLEGPQKRPSYRLCNGSRTLQSQEHELGKLVFTNGSQKEGEWLSEPEAQGEKPRNNDPLQVSRMAQCSSKNRRRMAQQKSEVRSQKSEVSTPPNPPLPGGDGAVDAVSKPNKKRKTKAQARAELADGWAEAISRIYERRNELYRSITGSESNAAPKNDLGQWQAAAGVLAETLQTFTDRGIQAWGFEGGPLTAAQAEGLVDAWVSACSTHNWIKRSPRLFVPDTLWGRVEKINKRIEWALERGWKAKDDARLRQHDEGEPTSNVVRF